MIPEKEFPLYAKVIVDIHAKALDRPFTYGVRKEQAGRIAIGSVVKVSFHNRIVVGYVVDLAEFPPSLPKHVKIKPIDEIADPRTLWDKEMIDLARWMEHYYGCTFLNAIKVLVPAPVRVKKDGSIPAEPMIKMAIFKSDPGDNWGKLERRAPVQFRALKMLKEQKGAIPLAQASKLADTTGAIFRALEKKGYVDIFEGSPKFKFFHKHPRKPTDDLPLTEDQKHVFEMLMEKYHSPNPEFALLFGITGSGKTEIYLQVIREVLAEGREAIVLVPEISLTPQAVERFRGRFGEEIAVLHSRLTGAERRQMWWKIRRKEVQVVLGARSAVFAPMENIGVIVVDEEHDGSYKQESEPRYHARQIAMIRAMSHNALIIMGSATPSLESYYMATEKKKYSFLTLDKRIGKSVLPEIQVVNLKKDFAGKKYCIIGDTLQREMRDVIDRDEQVMLFLNRRGYSGFLLCLECGRVIRCPYCDITLTYHKVGRLLKCHYCDYHREAPSICSFCKGHKIITPSLGIQKVEEEIREQFPGVSYIRMDRDTTKDRDAHHRILASFAGRKAQILLGTQMIAKGHDFPGVTLVGVVLADVSLYLPDFRSLERTYQVLIQVAGRAGRRESAGKVIIQTYNPKTPVIVAVSKQDYDEFYQWESGNRRPLNYPPFAHVINLLFTGKIEEMLREYSLVFADILGMKKFKGLFLAVLGPSPCTLSRIKSRYRWHITLKGMNVFKMVAVIRAVAEKLPPPTDISFNIDVDPISLM